MCSSVHEEGRVLLRYNAKQKKKQWRKTWNETVRRKEDVIVRELSVELKKWKVSVELNDVELKTGLSLTRRVVSSGYRRYNGLEKRLEVTGEKS